MNKPFELTACVARLSPGRLAVVATLLSISASPMVEAVFAQPAGSATAQTAPPQRKNSPEASNTTSSEYLLIGAGSGALLATAYYGFSNGGKTASSCGPLNCACPYLSITGGLIGLFSAKDLAATRRAEAPRVGATLNFSTVEVPLISTPLGLAVRDSLIAVVTDSGAQIVSATAKPLALRRRGNRFE